METTDTTTTRTSGPTAVRTVEAGKATITVTFPGSWPTQTLSGARAGRAMSVLITDQGGLPPKVGCRASHSLAVAEAERMSNPRVSRTRHGKVPMPARPTVAIPVTDA